MTITDVKRTKRGRLAVYAQGEFRFSADEQTASEFGLRPGAELSEEELARAQAAAEKRSAVEKALTLLSYRDHSGKELRDKLKGRVDAEAAEEAARRMEELGLVNDTAFARELAQELLERRLCGAARAVYELTRRGIPRGQAEETVAELDTDPQGRLARALRKKYPAGLPDEAARQRARAYFGRQGFAWDDIRAALREFEEENGETAGSGADDFGA